MKSLSRVRLLVTPWTAAYQAPPSMGFSRQEYWSGVPLLSPNRCRRFAINPISALTTTGPVTLGLTMVKFYPLNKVTAHRPQMSKELTSQRWCHKEIYSGTCWSCLFFFFLNKLSFISKTNFCLDLFLCSSFPHYTESKITRVMCHMNLKALEGIYLNIIKVMYDMPTANIIFNDDNQKCCL